MNPTLAIEVWIWSSASYNYSINGNGDSQYTINHYGRYVWVYVFAPYVAAIAAGLLARIHYNNLEEESVPSGEGTNAYIMPDQE